MSEHRFILEPYKTLKSRYECPNCRKKKKFARYIDTETGKHLADNVGRCERSDNCGHHYTPKQYFSDTGEKPEVMFENVTEQKKKDEPSVVSYIDRNVLQSSLSKHSENNFVKYLRQIFDEETVKCVVEKYKIGTSNKWHGSTVFWQIDVNGNARSGKIMQYDPKNGKRVKKPYDMVTWVHSVLKIENFNLKQCFFGEHLVKTSTGPIAIVESEKTAVIASVYLPQFTWLASTNKQGINDDKCLPIKGRKVILYPDLNAFDVWNKKAKWYGFTISDLLEKKATDDERKVGLDLADYLVRFKVSDFAPNHQLVKNNVNNHQLPTSEASKQDLHSSALRQSTGFDSKIKPEVLELHKRYTDAERAGILETHPHRDWICSMWQGVMIYYNRPNELAYYIEQLKQINI